MQHTKPDPVYVLGVNLEADAVQSYLREHLAGCKIPRVVAFHDILPREHTGKIFKLRLREPYWEKADRKI